MFELKNGIVNQENLNKIDVKVWNKKGLRLYLKLEISYIHNLKSKESYEYDTINADLGYIDISAKNKLSYKNVKFLDLDLLKNAIESSNNFKENVLIGHRMQQQVGIINNKITIENSAINFNSIKKFYNINA